MWVGEGSVGHPPTGGRLCGRAQMPTPGPGMDPTLLCGEVVYLFGDRPTGHWDGPLFLLPVIILSARTCTEATEAVRTPGTDPLETSAAPPCP